MNQTIRNGFHPFGRTDNSRLSLWWWTVDHWLLGATALLILAGVVLSFTSSPAAAARLHLTDPFHFAIRQSFFGAAAAGLDVKDSTTPVMINTMVAPRSQWSDVHHQTLSGLRSVRVKACG